MVVMAATWKSERGESDRYLHYLACLPFYCCIIASYHDIHERRADMNEWLEVGYRHAWHIKDLASAKVGVVITVVLFAGCGTVYQPHVHLYQVSNFGTSEQDRLRVTERRKGNSRYPATARSPARTPSLGIWTSLSAQILRVGVSFVIHK